MFSLYICTPSPRETFYYLRMNRICSYKTDFEKHLVDMKSWFQARGYPSDLIQKEMNKVKFSGNWDKNKEKAQKGYH